MAYARHNDYVVLTNDLDFGAILAASRHSKPSVVRVTAEDVSPEVVGIQVISAVRQVAIELEQAALLNVDS
jgi:predicted nuclease of predicted toxin-antitoxin system